MENIPHSSPLMQRGRRVRDSLALTGDHPELLAKLDHLVDEPNLNPALALKLSNLLDKIDAADGAKK